MAVDVIMPRLSDSMTEGVIVAWLKRDGDRVECGDEIVEIETDKATTAYAADSDGFLAIVAREGETLPVGAMIAQLLPNPGEASADRPTPDSTAETSSSARPDPGSNAPPRSDAESVSAVPPRVNASPLARRLAQERGIDIASLTGSGRGGRIMKEDVEAANSAASVDSSFDAAGAVEAKGDVELVMLGRTQTLIARRMSEAKATIPEFMVSMDTDVEAVFSLREDMRGHADPLPSINDFVTRAAALALRQHPRVNGSYRDGHVELHSRINVGIAVAAPGTLVVPTIFDTDQKSVSAIARDAQDLAGRVRDGTVTPAELAGGTFTVSNLGMFGVTRFTAVINPPQAAILAVGAAIARFVPDEEGQPRARRLIELTLTADHRVLYGSDAAAFLATIRELLTRPVALFG
jgi:pyruvate dehydrogenase E2 component (dihydrolipoamide acetyltransferase)